MKSQASRKIGHFNPPFFLKNAHVQTLGSYCLSLYKNPPSSTHFVTLPDGDQLALEVSIPKGNYTPKKVVLMMPGTAGSHLSRYLIRLAQRFLKYSIVVARLNFRGVATAKGRAKKVSHGGSSEDILFAIQALKKLFPSLELSAIGFSLSGNTLLKLAGEKSLNKDVKRILAICPPLELAKSSKLLDQKRNRIYQNSIVQTILRTILDPLSTFEYKPKYDLKGIRTLREFDEAFTAPSWGFKNAEDYYTQCSSLDLLHKIHIETHLLFAEDDPLVDSKGILQKALPSNLNILCTSKGGHMGFLSSSWRDPFWMDQQILYWLDV